MVKDHHNMLFGSRTRGEPRTLWSLFYCLSLAQTSGSQQWTHLSSKTHQAEHIIKSANTMEKHIPLCRKSTQVKLRNWDDITSHTEMWVVKCDAWYIRYSFTTFIWSAQPFCFRNYSSDKDRLPSVSIPKQHPPSWGTANKNQVLKHSWTTSLAQTSQTLDLVLFLLNCLTFSIKCWASRKQDAEHN